MHNIFLCPFNLMNQTPLLPLVLNCSLLLHCHSKLSFQEFTAVKQSYIVSKFRTSSKYLNKSTYLFFT